MKTRNLYRLDFFYKNIGSDMEFSDDLDNLISELHCQGYTIPVESDPGDKYDRYAQITTFRVPANLPGSYFELWQSDDAEIIKDTYFLEG